MRSLVFWMLCQKVSKARCSAFLSFLRAYLPMLINSSGAVQDFLEFPKRELGLGLRVKGQWLFALERIFSNPCSWRSPVHCLCVHQMRLRQDGYPRRPEHLGHMLHMHDVEVLGLDFLGLDLHRYLCRYDPDRYGEGRLFKECDICNFS